MLLRLSTGNYKSVDVRIGVQARAVTHVLAMRLNFVFHNSPLERRIVGSSVVGSCRYE